MKKLLFLIPNLKGGGAERVLVNLVNNLDTKKYDVTLMTIFDEGENKKYLKSHITYQSIFKKTFRGNSYIFKLFSPQFLYKRFIKDEYDIVIGYLEQVPTRILAGCPSKNTKKIAWLHIEIQNPKKFFAPFRGLKEAKWCYEQFDSIVGVSQTAINSLEQIIGMKEKMYVKYNTIETDMIINRSHEPIDDVVFGSNKINLVTVGRLVEQKGYERLLRIHKRMLEEGIKTHLYIIGQGELRSKFEEYIKQNHMSNDVTLLGYTDNPYKYVRRADLFVCSSYREGFSTAVTESLIVGTPVITTVCSGMEEMLESGKYGVIVNNDEESLYEGLRDMLLNKEKIQYYKKMVKERGRVFNTEETVKAVEDLLDSL